MGFNWEDVTVPDLKTLDGERFDEDDIRYVPLASGPEIARDTSTSILATSDIDSCIGAAAYDHATGIGLATHYGGTTLPGVETDYSTDRIHPHFHTYYTALRSQSEQAEIDVRIVVGNNPDEDLYDLAKQSVAPENTPQHVTVESCDTYYTGAAVPGGDNHEPDHEGSLALHTATGDFYTYKPRAIDRELDVFPAADD